MTPSKTHRVLLHLAAAGKFYPSAWKQFDAFRQDRKEIGDWPEYVYFENKKRRRCASGQCIGLQSRTTPSGDEAPAS